MLKSIKKPLHGCKLPKRCCLPRQILKRSTYPDLEQKLKEKKGASGRDWDVRLTWVPWILITLMMSPSFTEVALPLPPGIIVTSEIGLRFAVRSAFTQNFLLLRRPAVKVISNGKVSIQGFYSILQHLITTPWQYQNVRQNFVYSSISSKEASKPRRAKRAWEFRLSSNMFAKGIKVNFEILFNVFDRSKNLVKDGHHLYSVILMSNLNPLDEHFKIVGSNLSRTTAVHWRDSKLPDKKAIPCLGHLRAESLNGKYIAEGLTAEDMATLLPAWTMQLNLCPLSVPQGVFWFV